jgi:DUF4097 and DUF4098 domain-containing protein YvlB
LIKTKKASAIYLILMAATVATSLSGCRSVEARRDTSSMSDDDSGEISVSKMGGDIDAASAPNGASLSTMGGNIHVGDVAKYAKAKTMGGNITIDHASCQVDASTMGGVIHIGSANGAINASTMGGDIQARMVGSSSDRRDVELTSHGGTVTLAVPKDFPMDIQITLAYTKNAPRTYEIIDHIGLEQQETPDWDTSLGSPRRYIRAKGRVGNGLNHVVIKTVNGDVILKQE